MAIQGRFWESNVDLSLGGTSIAGVLPTGIVVRYRRAGDAAVQVKAMTALNWAEVSGITGLYTLKWTVEEMGIVGPFWFQVTGIDFDKHIGKFDVMPAQVGAILSPTKCVIAGNIADIGGEPDQATPIRFRIVKTPATFSGAFASGRFITTQADAYGAFSIALVRGAVVIVEIEGAGLKQQFTVPDRETANLIDLLPPINNNP